MECRYWSRFGIGWSWTKRVAAGERGNHADFVVSRKVRRVWYKEDGRGGWCYFGLRVHVRDLDLGFVRTAIGIAAAGKIHSCHLVHAVRLVGKIHG